MATGPLTPSSDFSRPRPPEPPPLRNGDRLTRPEFERRYAAMPHLNKAELIEGVVYMPSPVSMLHSSPHAHLLMWLGVYNAGTAGTEAGDNGTVRLDLDNEVQPDAFLMVLPRCGGQAQITLDHYVDGPPELVAEIAASSTSMDLHAKLNAYRRSGVREYLVWRAEEGGLDWFALQHGEYLPLPPGPDGVLRSTAFPGLWLDRPALLARDLQRVLAILQQGLASAEHEAFVARLAASPAPDA